MRRMLRTTRQATALCGLIICASLAATDESSMPTDREATIKALHGLGTLIGEWKGVAQPKRGSNAGAWSEKAQAAWDFENSSAEMVVRFEPGQQFQQASFSLGDDGKTPNLTLFPFKGESIALFRVPAESDSKSGDQQPREEVWIFESDGESVPQTRCSVRTISDIRITLLFEEKSNARASYRRLFEIGMTRAGARLAGGNSGERQCIVTGGLGTIKVSFEGKTYFVCCEGCKQAFDADPKGTIDNYRERLAAEAGKGR